MGKKLSHIEFLNRLNIVNTQYKSGNLLMLEEYKGKDTPILCKDKYGKIYTIPNNLFKNKTTSIKSALCKNSYFISKAKEVHSEINYDYSKVEYINSKTKISIIDPDYGEFKITPAHFLQGKTNRKRSIETNKLVRTLDIGTILERLIKIHGNKYKYDFTNYINTKSILNITCNDHGLFQQEIRRTLEGHGCQKCKNENTGYSHTKWKVAGNKSKNFDSYKLYIIQMFDLETNEKFYKIGKTYLTVEERFKSEINYNYKLIHIETDKADVISKLENKVHRLNKKHIYQPNIKFGGHTECFNKIDNTILNLLNIDFSN